MFAPPISRFRARAPRTSPRDFLLYGRRPHEVRISGGFTGSESSSELKNRRNRVLWQAVCSKQIRFTTACHHTQEILKAQSDLEPANLAELASPHHEVV